MRLPLRSLGMVWAGVLLALPAALTTMPSWAEDDSCDVPEHPARPAAGHWTGIFQCTTEVEMQSGSFAKTSTLKYAGDLEFDLVRYEDLDPVPETPKPRRRPLGVPPTPPPAPKVKLPEHGPVLGCPVGLSEPAKICGIANVTLTMSSTGMSLGTSSTSAAATNEPMELDIEGQEAPLTERFEEVNLLTSKKLSLGGRARLVYPDGTQNSTSYDTSNMHPFDYRYPKKEKMFPLHVTGTSCGVITGEVDGAQLQTLVEQRGFGLHASVKESNWVATLDERDVEFEKAVHALASEPIPADLTWHYIEAFRTAYNKLRAGTLTDYKRCVMVPLDRKNIQIHIAGLRILLDTFPTVAEGSSRPVFQAAAQRVLEVRRMLELRGMDDCPLALKAAEVILQRLEELRKKGS